jgi:hypothetical protein
MSTRVTTPTGSTSPVARALGRAVAAALLAALLGAACTALLYVWHPVLRLEFDRSLPTVVSGVYGAERDERAALTFAWTGPELTLRLPGLDRHVPWMLDLRVRGAHPQPSENPEISIRSDGAVLVTHRTTPDFEVLRVTIPSHPEERRGATITIRSSSTFVPGPSDPRALGVMLDWLSLTPDGAVLPPPAALGGAALSSACMGAAIALLGVTAGSAIGGAVLLSAGTAAIIARGFGPLTTFPATGSTLGAGIAIGLALFSLALQRLRGEPFRNTARFAAGFAASALFLKLLVLLHPDMPTGEALFHAHRLQDMMSGHLNVAPAGSGANPFEAAPAFYAFASLFAWLLPKDASALALVRIVACAVDTLAGLLLYAAIVRAWGDRLAAAIAVALYLLIPLDFAMMAAGNLTQAFAQAAAVVGFVTMSAAGVRVERGLSVTVLAAVLAVAYLSDPSTFVVLSMTTVATAALFWLRGGPVLRSPAAALILASAVAAAVAVAIYYAHFAQTYQSELVRLWHDIAMTRHAGDHGITDRALVTLRSATLYFGEPVLVLSIIGAWRMTMRGMSDRLTLTTAGSALTCLLLLIVGLLTPLDAQYKYAIPVVAVAAVAAAAGSSQSWPAGPSWRALTIILLAGAAIVGVRNWWSALG